MRPRKGAVVLLSVALIISVFAGCGSKQPSKPSGSDSKNSTDSKMVGNMQISNLPIVKDPETYKIAVSKEPTCKNNFSEKECVKVSEQKTNVKIDWMEIPQTGWQEKVNIMFASGDLPDAFLGGVEVMKNKASLAPLSDLIEKYGPNIKQIFTTRPDVKKALTCTDGKIYSLPTGDDIINNLISDTMWINSDWLKKLNLTMPTTTDEFYNVLKAFKEKDPNGNGKADEIPFCPSTSNYAATLDSMFGSFSTLDNGNHIRIQDGKVIFTPSEQGYFDGLKWFNKLYTEKLMNQEYFTEQFQQWKAKGDSQEVIVGVAMSWHPDNFIAANKADPYVVVPPLKGTSGSQLWNKASEPMGNMSGFAITSKCKHPEVLVRWYDFNNSNIDMINLWNYGPEGTGVWRKVDGGKWEVIYDNIPKGSSLAEFRRTIGAGPGGPIYAYSKYSSPDVMKFDPRNQKKYDAVKVYQPFTPKEVIPVGFEDPAKADERSILKTDIDNYLKKFKADAVMQGLDSVKWQDHMNKLKSLKTDQYTKMWQEFYDSHK